MKRHGVSLALYLIAATAGWSDASTALFQTSSPAVVYIQQAVMILPEYFPDPTLLGKLEKNLNRTLLNDYLPLESGSGFFIDRWGHIATNNHVIDHKDEKKMREEGGTGWGSYIDSAFKDSEMTALEKRTLKVALFRAISAGPYTLQVLVGNRSTYEAKVLASDEKRDLAVLEISLQGNPALTFAPNDTAKVGEDVFSMGYPFGSFVVRQLDNLSATFTKGSVSALRKEDLGIQHTATINPGNSGGPLLNVRGLVEGVNAAERTNANNTYFAIPASVVRLFLQEQNLSQVKLLAPLSSSLNSIDANFLTKNALGEYEVSADLIFSQEKGSKVFVDGALIGTTPLFWNPPKAAFQLRIEGKATYSEGRIRVLKSLQGSTEINLPEAPYQGRLTATTTTPGVSLLVDGESIGSTPVSVELPVGVHTLTAKSKGMYFPSTSLNIERDQETTVAVEGEPVVPIAFRGIDPRPAIKATRGELVLSILPRDSFELPAGAWQISWQGTEVYNDASLALSVDSSHGTLDAYPFIAHGTLVIADFDPEATVYLDGAAQTVDVTGRLQVAVGDHSIKVVQRGWNPVKKSNVPVSKNTTTNLNFMRTHSSGAFGNYFLWPGAAGTLLGAALAGIEYYRFKDSVALANTTNYAEYTDWKNAAHIGYTCGLIGTGIALAAVATGLFLNATLDDDVKRDY